MLYFKFCAVKKNYKFKYAVTVAWSHKNKKSPQRTTKIIPFIDQYNWKEISFLSHINNWKNFET